MISKQQAVPIWTAAGFTAREAREWTRNWGTNTVEDEAWMAKRARLWHDCGLTGQDAAAWSFGDITVGLGPAIIHRVHGLTHHQNVPGYCAGLITATGEDADDLAEHLYYYGTQDRESRLIRWATSGLPPSRILAYWHARVTHSEALVGGYNDDAVDVLAALTTPHCPLILRTAA